MTAYLQYQNREDLKSLLIFLRENNLDVIKAFGQPPYYFLTNTYTIPYHQFGLPQYTDFVNIEYKLCDICDQVLCFRIPRKVKIIYRDIEQIIPQVGSLQLYHYKSDEFLIINVQQIHRTNEATGYIIFTK